MIFDSDLGIDEVEGDTEEVGVLGVEDADAFKADLTATSGLEYRSLERRDNTTTRETKLINT